MSARSFVMQPGRVTYIATGRDKARARAYATISALFFPIIMQLPSRPADRPLPLKRIGERRIRSLKNPNLGRGISRQRDREREIFAGALFS